MMLVMLKVMMALMVVDGDGDGEDRMFMMFGAGVEVNPSITTQ